jgi:hypothetical protein
LERASICRVNNERRFAGPLKHAHEAIVLYQDRRGPPGESISPYSGEIDGEIEIVVNILGACVRRSATSLVGVENKRRRVTARKRRIRQRVLIIRSVEGAILQANRYAHAACEGYIDDVG